jgi:hypothetical protein
MLMLTIFLQTVQMASEIRKIGNKILKPYAGCIWALVSNIAKRMSQEERSIFWEVTVSVSKQKKNVYTV